MDDQDIRKFALQLAIDQVPNGTVWEIIFALAARFETFINHGTYDTPVADQNAEKIREAFTSELKRLIGPGPFTIEDTDRFADVVIEIAKEAADK